MKSIYNKVYAIAAMVLASGGAMAQGLNSAYYTNDYKYRHTMNPAFGNEQNYVSLPLLGNLNVGLHGNFGYEDLIMNNPQYGISSDKRMTTFMHPDISASDALKGLNSGNNRIVGDIGVTILSAGFKAFGGYNTIELNSKTSFGMSLPYELFAFAKNIGNNTYNIGDINMKAQSYTELAFGHSRQIDDRLRVGAKVKLLFGIGRSDVEFKDIKADLSAEDKWSMSGEAKANVSLAGFSYKIEEKEYYNEDWGTYETVNDIDIDQVGLSGFGLAFDLGGVYKIDDDWTVNAAILDLGFINWKNNVQASNRDKSFEFNGFHDMTVEGKNNKTESGGNTFDDEADSYGDQIADFANLTDDGDLGSRTTGIGATINVGCEYNLPVYRPITFGLLSSTRINGPYSWTEGRLSANWTPLSWLDGGVSFAVNSFTTSMGWVLNIHPKGCNFFIGADHLLGKTSKEGIPLSSNASINRGVNITW